MPTYEYECSKCGFQFEEFQNMTDKPLKHCPKCNGNLRRLISGGAGIIFKGSGFYATDYKRSQVPVRSEQKSKALTKPSEKPAPAKEKTPEVTPSKPSDDTKK